jgi:phage tail tape-measure protein
VELKTPGERKDLNDALMLLAAKKAKDETDRLSAMVATTVTAGLHVTEKVAKKVKTKPTEQRDVSDVESSEETGDYCTPPLNPPQPKRVLDPPPC